jgi:H+-transporting ATPase
MLPARPSDPVTGLSSAEARRRLSQFGPNTTPDPAVHPIRLLLGKLSAPVACLLEAAIVLQLYLGEYIEASVVTVLLVFNTVLGFIHEGRAQATVAALKSRLALLAAVHRDGRWSTIAASELVPGDIVKLSLGAVVPADALLISGGVLLDHSTLTGESLPIEAGPGAATYAGAMVRRGEAVAEVTATGPRSKFGRTAELVRTAHVVSGQQKAIFRVVRNLALLNGIVTAALLTYAYAIGLPISEFVPLILVAVLATVPVALPATFTLATAIGAQALARRGVLPTRLSAVDEAASMTVLCADKTGTLTQNELAVTVVRVFSGYDATRLLALAATASSDGGQDPVDNAVRRAAQKAGASLPQPLRFIPFDPAKKIAEAAMVDAAGAELRVVKGAFATVAHLAKPDVSAVEAAMKLELEGFRVLGVAVGLPGNLLLAGILALSDPPRADAKFCIGELRRLGVDVIMITGDAPETAGVIAREVGIAGPVYPDHTIKDDSAVETFSVFAGVLPEDKFTLVKNLQRAGRTVGMCGDGANDAPALRQAQIGIAVSTATDVAKSAAGVVLTEPGLAGIVTAVREGRVTFQRILTYTLRSIVHKVRQVLFLAFGLLLTGHPVVTPMLMALSMITGDFLAMSATTDNVEPSSLPNAWRIGTLTAAGAVMGFFDLLFCAGVLIAGKYVCGLSMPELQTLTLVTLVFNGQAVFYVVRERRRLWASCPSTIVLLCSAADLLIIPTLAVNGLLMAPIPLSIIAGVFVAAVGLALALDLVKIALFARWRMV